MSWVHGFIFIAGIPRRCFNILPQAIGSQAKTSFLCILNGCIAIYLKDFRVKQLLQIVLISTVTFVVMPVQAGLNKWVDEKGQVHYGDRVPSKYLNQQRETLNEQGVVVKQHEAAKTDEELAKEKALQKQHAAAEKERMIAARKAALRDRVLLETFTTEADLVHAREARVEAVDTQILLTETIIKDQEKKLENLKKRIASIEKSGRVVPENLHKEQVSVSRQLETHYKFVESKNEEKQNIIEKFDDDIKRFKELMALKKKKQ